MKLLTLVIFVPIAWAWMELVPGDRVEDCSEPGKHANIADFSGSEIVMESDTDFFLNGTFKFLKPLHSPWKVNVIGERWYRDQWVPGAEKKLSDACGEMHNKAYPTYPFFEGQKGCPLEPGVSSNFCSVHHFLTSLKPGPMDLEHGEVSSRWILLLSTTLCWKMENECHWLF
jgi:hypothetical protein